MIVWAYSPSVGSATCIGSARPCFSAYQPYSFSGVSSPSIPRNAPADTRKTRLLPMIAIGSRSMTEATLTPLCPGM